MLKEAEDQGLLRVYLTRWRTTRSLEEMSLLSWQQAEAILDVGGDE